MRIAPELLRPDDVLADGGVVQSEAPVDHDTYVSAIVRYANGETQIRDFDKTQTLDITRRPS